MSRRADDINPDPRAAPTEFETLLQLIHERFERMSKSHQQISIYLTQNPNEVAVHSVNAIAERCGIHASSFVRFAQSLGYTGFKDLQGLFQKRLETAAPGFEARVRALESDLEDRHDPTDFGFLQDLVVKDIASLQALLDTVTTDDLSKAADLLAGASTAYLLGQLRSAPIVDFLRYMLTMIGKRCVLLDPSGGLATHMAKTMSKDDVLIAVSFRYYANEVVSIVDAVCEAGPHIVAISDGTLSPLAKSADVLFSVPEHRHTFSRSIAAPMCISQALVLATAARLQVDAKQPQIPTVTSSAK